MKKIGVVLSGCGAQDGSEIHEAVITLLALDRPGVDTKIMAPDMDQFQVINHFSGKTMDTKRNIFIESSRIARGDIVPINTIRGKDIDAMIFPGGTGMAKNIFDYHMAGPDFKIVPDVERITTELLMLRKPIGAICIAPLMVAKILQNMGRNGTVTVGSNKKFKKDVEIMGINTEQVGAEDIVLDDVNKIISTPAYVEANSIGQVSEGITKLVDKILELV
tara:strand:+ start:460 stop:1119 length:660 start_codon:yes stop_codon:yes gene_type:complete